MKARGFSLVELTVGLCVASFVAAAATMSLGAAGIAMKQHLVKSRIEDRAWLALAAIVRDLDATTTWRMCTEARDCPQKAMAREYAVPVLLAGDIGWLVADELRRCAGSCETLVDGVAALDIVADVPVSGGLIDRQPFLQRHGSDVRAIEVTVRMHDGRRFSRVVVRGGA